MRKSWLLPLFAVLSVATGPAAAQPPRVTQPAIFVGDPAVAPAPGEGRGLFTAAENGSDKNGSNGNGNGNGANGEEEEPPEHIRDNAYFVEEAFNQEPGEVQHIFNWINFWESSKAGRSREFTMSYTMELPLGSQKHQFSFTTQFQTLYEKPAGGPAEQVGDVGDTFLNYRYQLLADDDFLWVAPRFSLILPTGDERLGLGNGEVGYQFNLPVSRYGESFDCHFNAGYTFVPDAVVPIAPGLLSVGRNVHGYNLGVSTFWKPQTYLHFFVEGLALWEEGLDDAGLREHTIEVFVNPGVRYAVCQFEEVEWVLGVSVPVGLTRDAPDVGVFAYMSVEHTFRKVKENADGCR
jgi:hypothetical protein